MEKKIVHLTMVNYKKDPEFFNEIYSELRYNPNKHLISRRLSAYQNIPSHKGFTIEYKRDGSCNHFLTINNKEIEIVQLTCDLGFYNEVEKCLDFKLANFSIELYIIRKNPEYVENTMIMDLDELTYYLNMQGNETAKLINEFPVLNSCEYSQNGFNYISDGRKILSTYFPQFKGSFPALDIYFQDELKEIFAITSNALAFLYKHKDRVFEEIELMNNNRYSSQLNIYPRFNNAISEVAGGLYSFWERVAFVFNEFFPLNPLSDRLPSFYQYFDKQNQKIGATLKTANFNWFVARLDNEHKRLGELRHPMIHYNKHSSPSGMRSAELMKQHNSVNPTVLKQTWSNELEFLKSELTVLSISLEKMFMVIEEWAIATSKTEVIQI
jgi:hypothetical protein